MDMGSGQMRGMSSPPSSDMNAAQGMNGMGHHSMMHMTFFWGNQALVLFDKWPAGRPGMYALSLIFVLVMAFLLEWLCHTEFIKPSWSRFAAALAQTVLYTVRVGLGYLVMLSLMSFNGGVFIAAVVGHALGFFFFGSRAFHKSDYDRGFGLPANMACSSR